MAIKKFDGMWSTALALGYIVSIAILDYRGITYFDLPNWAANLAVPVGLLTNVQAADSAWIGVGTLYLAFSLVMWAIFGFIFDLEATQ